jgi:hypothetical protein
LHVSAKGSLGRSGPPRSRHLLAQRGRRQVARRPRRHEVPTPVQDFDRRTLLGGPVQDGGVLQVLPRRLRFGLRGRCGSLEILSPGTVTSTYTAASRCSHRRRSTTALSTSAASRAGSASAKPMPPTRKAWLDPLRRPPSRATWPASTEPPKGLARHLATSKEMTRGRLVSPLPVMPLEFDIVIGLGSPELLPSALAAPFGRWRPRHPSASRAVFRPRKQRLGQPASGLITTKPLRL